MFRTINANAFRIKDTLERKGYKFFTEGVYNVNIVGIRNSSFTNKVTNRFDDAMIIIEMIFII